MAPRAPNLNSRHRRNPPCALPVEEWPLPLLSGGRLDKVYVARYRDGKKAPKGEVEGKKSSYR
jgi:hypothetical protein